MQSRQEGVADAAVSVLARDGLRGLTHRAVDAEARLPPGSTSNCFRTRRELLDAIVARLEALDLASLGATAPDSETVSPDETSWYVPGSDGSPDLTTTPALAAFLAQRVDAMTHPPHLRSTRARLALILDETARPAFDAGHQRFVGLLVQLLRDCGHPSPEPAARAVGDLADGALLHAVSLRSRPIDVPELAAAIERLLAD